MDMIKTSIHLEFLGGLAVFTISNHLAVSMMDFHRFAQKCVPGQGATQTAQNGASGADFQVGS